MYFFPLSVTAINVNVFTCKGRHYVAWCTVPHNSLPTIPSKIKWYLEYTNSTVEEIQCPVQQTSKPSTWTSPLELSDYPKYRAAIIMWFFLYINLSSPVNFISYFHLLFLKLPDCEWNEVSINLSMVWKFIQIFKQL